MKQSIKIEDISHYTVEYQVIAIGQELDERKANPEKSLLYYYVSVLPPTDISARTPIDVLMKVERHLLTQQSEAQRLMEERNIDAESEEWKPIGV